MIIPIYQPPGNSSHQIAHAVGEKFQTKATHTGTLDPMAEGVLVVLMGNSRFKKSHFSNWKKTYEFKILLGWETDSLDLLGMPENFQPLNETQINKFLAATYSTPPIQKQETPSFSAKRWRGKSLHHWAKTGVTIPTFTQAIQIYHLAVKSVKRVSSTFLQNYVEQKVSAVNGNFRQNEIIKEWQKSISISNNYSYPLVTVTATTSKRTYIRALVRDWTNKSGVPATTFHIKRVKNGPWSIQNCHHLDLITQKMPL